MRVSLSSLLLALAALVAGIDIGWASLGRVMLDGAAYARLGGLALLLVAGGAFYQHRRPDPRLAAMLTGSGFLIAFSLGASVLNYLLIGHAGARMDVQLAALDRAMGFDWPRLMAWMARHPRLNLAALAAYSSMLPQVALLTIALATAEPECAYRFLLAVALSALAAIAIWSFAPSFGAFSVYPPPPAMALALDQSYAQVLVRLLHDGPGLISPRDAKGLIGFPSYHAVLALLVTWHARKISWLRWPAVVLNSAVLLATPVQGGHHLVDVLAAFPVAAVTLLLVGVAGRMVKPSAVVNKASNLTIRPVPQGLFRIALEQKPEREACAIKPKLSGLS